MKSYRSIIITAIIALALGLGAGYLFFGNSDSGPSVPMASQPELTETTTWTCSMHPQVRQNEPGLCPICAMELIPLESASSDDPLLLQMTPEAVRLSDIQTTTVGTQTGGPGKTIRLSGKVKADERLASSLVTHLPGRIEKLYVSFTGEQVNKGQKLASIYSPDLLTAQRELLEAAKLQEVNPGLLEAARNKLRYWKVDEEFINTVEEKGEVLETVMLYAEESGIVTNKRVAVGDYLKQGEPLFDLVNLQNVWVIFDAYEEDLPAVAKGDRIEFTTPALPGRTFNTRITFIDPVIDPETRVAALRTEVSNASGLLKPEMLVYGRLQNKPLSGAQLTIPKSAVLWTGTRSVVYVKVPGMDIPSFQFREVELGESLGDSYQLLSGLQAGEEVVTNGSFTIDAAAQLNNQTSMMNRNVTIKGKEQTDQLPDYTSAVPEKFKEQLAKVSNAYLVLKDALVETDAVKAKEATKQLAGRLSKMDMTLLKDEPHQYWMKQSSSLQAHNQEIAAGKEVEEQRRQFYFLSQVLIRMIKVFGIPEGTLYVQHCPMANNDKGADWISKEKEINNPYYGDKMLRCGLITDTISRGAE